jgi:hypothetical protein
MRPDRSITPDVSDVAITRSRGLLILAALGASAALGLAIGVTCRDRPVPSHSEERINPNSAPIGSLIRLPGIGPGRAHAIAAHRRQKAPAQVAFSRPHDVQQVRGIGPATVSNIMPWLVFGPRENVTDSDADQPAVTTASKRSP